MSLLNLASGGWSNPWPSLPGDLEALFGGFLAQDTRLLELHGSADSGLPDNKLLVHRLSGYEAVNEGFRYEVECLSSDAFIPLKTLEGIPLQITLRTASGARRELNGVVTEARSEGSDGALAVYRLILEPVTATLKLGRTSRVFLGKTDLEVVLLLLREELQNNPVFAACLNLDNRCLGNFPVREFLFLCDENKWDFIRRRLARIGVSFVFAPTQEGSLDFPQHTLILFNDSRDLDENEAGVVRFHRADGTEQADTITQWHARRTLQCGRVTRRTWDHHSGSLSTTTEALRSDQGEFGNALARTLEDYRHEAPLEHDDLRAHEARTVTRAKVREQRTKAFAGEGTVRDFRAGTSFTLSEHPVHDQAFVLTRVELEAENNLPKDLRTCFAKASATPPLPYRVRFECLRVGIPILPEELPAPPPGLQTATVVGPGNEAVHTDALGRIKVRFHGTRPEEHPEAGASGTDKDSCWIRLLQPWSSQGMGGNFLPRVGDEVVVSFLANDPDKPVILGVLPGGTRKPGRFSEASELPGDRTISGLRSRSHRGRDGNQLLFDDTPGELRTQLASDHAASALSLGYLTEPRARGVAAPRGEGAELRTDGTAAIRAAKGLLLTAAAQHGAQLAREDLAELFEAFKSLTESLGNYAGQHQGLAPHLEHPKALQDRLQAWETGTNTRPRTQRPGDGQRLIALSAPDGLAAATPKTAVVYAGENLDLAAQQYSHITVGQQLVVNAGTGLSLFSHSGGFKAIAHQDALELQAQHGDIVLTAAQNLKLFASENELLLVAARKLTLMCGGSYLTLAPEGIVVGGPAFTGKVGSYSWPGTDLKNMDMPRIDMGKTQRQFQHLSKTTDEPVPDVPYTIHKKDGGVIQGKTDAQGLTQGLDLEDMEILGVTFEGEEGTDA